MGKNNKNILLLINSTYDDLGEAEKRVVAYLKKYPEEIINMPINILAEKVKVSVSTVIRLCKKIGIPGYTDLKIELAKDLAAGHQEGYSGIESDDDFNTLFNRVDKILAITISNSFKMLKKEEVKKVIKALNDAGSVLVIGMSGSAIIADLFSYRLLKLNIDAQSSNNRGRIPLLINKMEKNDVIFAMSHSGANNVINENVELANENGCITIALTNSRNSDLAKIAKLKMVTAISSELLGGEAGTKRIVQASVVELLCILITLGKHEYGEKNISQRFI